MKNQYKIIAGDALVFKRRFEAFRGYVGKLRLIPCLSTVSVQEITGVEADGNWTFSAEDTSGFSTDGYTYCIYFTKGTESVTAEVGALIVTADLRTASAGFDPRSKWEKELDAALELMSNWDSLGKYRKYKIGDREIEYGSQSELMSRIRFLRTMVAKEKGLMLKQPFDIRVVTTGAW